MCFSTISKKYKSCYFTNLMYILGFGYLEVYMLPSALVYKVALGCGEHAFCCYFSVPVSEVGDFTLVF
jgi:hypothetical protein